MLFYTTIGFSYCTKKQKENGDDMIVHLEKMLIYVRTLQES